MKCGAYMTLMDYLKDSKNKRLVIGGHRGHQSEVRENTIRNYAQLLGKNIPYVEIDVQLTKDDQIVIFHDSKLETGTSLSGEIRGYSLEALRQSFEIDTAADTIVWCKEHHMGIAFELKTQVLQSLPERRTVAEQLAELIAKNGFYQDCFVFGKDYETLSIIKSLDQRIHIGVIAPANPEEALPLMERLGAFLYLDYLEGFTEPLVRQLHEAGCFLDGSVVNTEEALKEALRLGVDMVESDEPEKILAILKKIKEGED